MEIMHKKFVFIILVFFIYLTGCQSIKDGLEGNKKTKSAEEFLIQKKNPLVLPPDYNKLPEPKSNEKKVSRDEDIKSILKTPQKKKSSDTSSSIEQKILNKIRKW